MEKAAYVSTAIYLVKYRNIYLVIYRKIKLINFQIH